MNRFPRLIISFYFFFGKVFFSFSSFFPDVDSIYITINARLKKKRERQRKTETGTEQKEKKKDKYRERKREKFEKVSLNK